jgi:hypothetical protein
VVGLLVGDILEEGGRVVVGLVVGPRRERLARGILGDCGGTEYLLGFEIAVGFGVEGFRGAEPRKGGLIGLTNVVDEVAGCHGCG